jgi:segregation and condensation protein B
MDAVDQRRVVEALILASGEPISAARLAQIVPDCTPGTAKDLVNALNEEYQQQDRAFEIWEVAGGYQLRTRAEFSGYLQQLQGQRPLRLSRASLESLAIIAYKQPVTRSEVELVRGVDSGAVMKSLLDRRLVRIVGHREVPGRPMLYGTSRRFLEIFGLESLQQLPSLRELEELAREHGVKLSEDGSVETAAVAPVSVLEEGAEPDASEIDADLASSAAPDPVADEDEHYADVDADEDDFESTVF